MAVIWRSVLGTRTNAMVRTVKSQRPGLPMLRSSLGRCALRALETTVANKPVTGETAYKP